MDFTFLEAIASNFDQNESFRNFSVLFPRYDLNEKSFWNVLTVGWTNFISFLDETLVRQLFYPNGGKESMSIYSGNEEIYTKWFPNGKLHKHGRYRDAKENGLWVFKRQDGSLVSKITFRQGVRDGPAIYYFMDGTISLQVQYDDGLRGGLWTSWYDETEEVARHMETRINYQDEVKDGFYERWYPNGNKDKEGTYKNNKKVGKWSFWAPSGDLLDIKYY